MFTRHWTLSEWYRLRGQSLGSPLRLDFALDRPVLYLSAVMDECNSDDPNGVSVLHIQLERVCANFSKLDNVLVSITTHYTCMQRTQVKKHSYRRRAEHQL